VVDMGMLLECEVWISAFVIRNSEFDISVGYVQLFTTKRVTVKTSAKYFQ